MLLQLRDSFLADHLGRKVLVHAQTRAVAASAIQVILFQLSHTANAETSLEASQWQYLDNKVGFTVGGSWRGQALVLCAAATREADAGHACCRSGNDALQECAAHRRAPDSLC